MSQLDRINNKIVDINQLSFLLSYYRFKSLNVVFSNGCFDILHRGHIEYLSKAADLGNILIVGLNTDDSVKRIKGVNRPIQDQNTRALTLASLQFINHVVLFDEDTPINLIKIIKPSILVKGADYKIKDIVGADIVLKNGGRVETIELTEGYTTSNIIKKLEK